MNNPYAARRRAALREAGKQDNVSAVLVSRPEDVGYLSGFTGDDSVLLITQRRACLVTDGRYDEQAMAECPGIAVYVRDGALSAAVAAVAKSWRLRRLGVQADHVTLQMYGALKKRLRGVRLVELTDVTAARAVKDDGEIRIIRRAVRVAQQACRDLLAPGAKALVGRTEREVAAELDYRMRCGGADEPAFETIVAAGPHSSQPHYRPGSTKIRRGQPVLIDWGARVAGYCSDLTRVVFTGKIPPKLVEIYEVVLAAQAAGIAAVKAGVSGTTPDAAARDVIRRAGFEKHFVHGLGHGIGRQVHEAPGLSRLSKRRLRRGMIVTVEPGIYLPGVGGVRIEDDVLVTPRGRQVISTLAKTLDRAVLG